MAQDEPVTNDVASRSRVVVGVPRETVEGETRVSLIPDTVRNLSGKGVDVIVQSGAGDGASIHDDEYAAAGATVLPDAAAVYEQADVIIKIQAPRPDGDVEMLREGQILVSPLAPLSNHDLVRTMADRKVTTLAMDAVPRITRAQSMDALSAMSTIGGYKAVILAADHLPKFFPLLMTAAGTIAPAKVLVLGAGVAGLQAIATARRLGAMVEAYDTRPVVKEQVESLGAKFIEIDVGASDTQAAGGYARELTPDEARRQQEALNEHVARFDVVVTTALVPGRPAPKLIPAPAVEAMRTGSVIVDLAAETGGNCELTEPGEIVVREGVTVIGLLNLPARLPVHASQMYSRVIQNFLGLLIKDGAVDLNMDDEIIKGMCITRDGAVVQEQTRKVMGLEEAEPPKAAEPAADDTGADDDAGDATQADAAPGERDETPPDNQVDASPVGDDEPGNASGDNEESAEDVGVSQADDDRLPGEGDKPATQ